MATLVICALAGVHQPKRRRASKINFDSDLEFMLIRPLLLAQISGTAKKIHTNYETSSAAKAATERIGNLTQKSAQAKSKNRKGCQEKTNPSRCVMLSEVKHLFGSFLFPSRKQILRRYVPQNDTVRKSYRMACRADSSYRLASTDFMNPL